MPIGNSLTVVPSYGRDYPSKAKAAAAWLEGKDFTIQDMSADRDDGRPCSIRDFPPARGVTVKIRYKSLTMAVLVRPDGTYT